MKLILTILILSTSTIAFGQLRHLKSGEYRNIDTSYRSKITIKSDSFYFYDTRHNSCFLWAKYNGIWRQEKDTIIFSWVVNQIEENLSYKASVDSNSNNINFDFVYDDNEPIRNVRLCYKHDEMLECKYYYSDSVGHISIPKQINYNKASLLSDEAYALIGLSIKNEIVEINQSGVVDTTSNYFRYTIKKNVKVKTLIITNKYILKNKTLYYADKNRDDFFKNWGDYKLYSW